MLAATITVSSVFTVRSRTASAVILAGCVSESSFVTSAWKRRPVVGSYHTPEVAPVTFSPNVACPVRAWTISSESEARQCTVAPALTFVSKSFRGSIASKLTFRQKAERILTYAKPAEVVLGTITSQAKSVLYQLKLNPAMYVSHSTILM